MSALNKQYYYFANELIQERYVTYTVYDFFVRNNGYINPDKVNVLVRIDVDSGLELCIPLAEDLHTRGIRASFYFLTNPTRYYDIWNSPVPRAVRGFGFEVGVHSDHYYEQIILGIDALKQIKDDVKRLSELIGEPVKGMVFHGHPVIDKIGKRNWDIYKNEPPHELGLVYHDGTLENMHSMRLAIRILDYLGVVNGWRYWPRYPQRALRRIPLGSVVVLYVHPENFFRIERQFRGLSFTKLVFDLYYLARIRLRHQLIGAIIGEGQSARAAMRKLLGWRRYGERLNDYKKKR